MERNFRRLPRTNGWKMSSVFLILTASATILQASRQPSVVVSNADRIVVLTFDDAVKSQRTVVAPLLKDLGFGATFFVSHRWMVDDPEHYLTWQEIAEIHQMGFEIGNHSWTHPDYSSHDQISYAVFCLKKKGKIFHISVNKVKVKNPRLVGGVTSELPHFPVSQTTLEKSVTK